MYQPQNDPKIYYQMLHEKRKTELLLCALRLDIFSYLGEWSKSKQVADKTKINERNLSFFLNALASIGLLEKKENVYRNTSQSNEFLNKKSPVYLGECILFRENMMSLENLEEQVEKGPKRNILERNKGVEVYDFYEAARVSIPEMYTGRVQSFINAVDRLFPNNPPMKVLDLGGGSGILAIELARTFSNCQGVIFEHPSVAALPQSIILQQGLEKQVSVLTGDFNLDDIGHRYDVIIASGILDFAVDHLEILIRKIYDALTPRGYLYIVTHGVSEDYQIPSNTILGWLSGHLDGLNVLLTKKTIDNVLTEQGFTSVKSQKVRGTFTDLQGEFYCKK